NQYYLYDSLRLFFDNGGGDCYIVSVGAYKTSSPYIDSTELIAGVDAVAKYDEPTILLFPDAAGLSSADSLATVQQKALSQCGKLGDRVAVLDTLKNDALGESFRDKIGINNLKYGAAYTPWLNLNYRKNFGYADINGKIRKGSLTGLQVSALASDKDTLDLIKKIDQVITDGATLKSRINTLVGADGTIANQFAKLVANYKTQAVANKKDNLRALFGKLYDLAHLVDGLVTGTPLTNPDLIGVTGDPTKKGDIDATIRGVLKPAYLDLIKLETEVHNDIASYGATIWNVDPDPSAAGWDGLFTGAAPATLLDVIPAVGGSVTEENQLDAALPCILKAFSVVSGGIDSLVSAVGNYPKVYEQSLYNNFAPFRNIVNGINNTLTVCPPSGAIAGIYALVDNTRGVWKAPANVSLNSVVSPIQAFALSETDALNVDPTAGKSINAIRAFSGKGTLVWGARTLAGNDNEWRYVSVRRFFNMVEESVKKSTYWAVFEPNDANTWVKVRGMIENYLTQKWREGALAGATTKEAFFVRCGLGVTMNAQDILEGRMNVEIGMAVVRPAEFIILKFSHKLQTS
ncbi:MAG TPA: phage tail sheath C-terminal domain-containing protein, partial [Gallionella sp.]|nr:phage tail sheath C-terminal domain-containing protein [Gallionella sp.]